MNASQKTLCTLVVLALGSAACGTSTPAVAGGGAITIVFPQDPYSLNPTKDGGEQGNYIQQQMRDRLVMYDNNDRLVPGLATSWETPDPLTYVFHLRHGVQFSNGSPFTAADMKYTFDTVALSSNSQLAGNTPYISGAVVVDPYTFKVTFSQPYPDFLDDMADNGTLGAIPNHWMDTCGSTCDTTTMGTGPFKLKEWARADHLTLVWNPSYWDAAAFPHHLNQVTYRVVPDPTAEEVQLKTGAADILYNVPLKDVSTLANTSGVTIYKHHSGLLTEIALNTLSAPFNNLLVRQAMELAINRQQVVNTVLYGYGEVPKGVFPSWIRAYDPSTPAPVYDPTGAMALLSQAGYGPSHPLSFELRYTTEAFSPDEATLVQAQLAQVGVQVKLTQMEKGAFYGLILQGPGVDHKAWQAGIAVYFFGTIAKDYQYDQFAASNFLDAANVNLPGGYSDPQLASIVDQAASEPDPAKRNALIKQEVQILSTDSLYVFLAFQDNVQAARSRVHGFQALVEFEFPIKYVSVSG